VDDNSPNFTDWVSAISTFLTLVVAVGAGIVAWKQLGEASAAREQTKDLELEKSQPYVVMSMEESVSPQFIDLVLRNYGPTAAYDVKVELDPWPKRTHDGKDVQLPEVIPVMAPGQEWRTHWDEGSARMDSDLPEKHVGKVTFLGVERAALHSDAILDWSIYKSRIWTVMYGIHDLTQAVRTMRDTQKKWSENIHGGLKVFSRDGDAKDERFAEEARAIREEHAANPPRRRAQQRQPTTVSEEEK
jgi:hypothetical protein